MFRFGTSPLAPGHAPLLQPDDLDLLRQRLELRVASDEFGFAFLRQCGGEGVGEAQFVASLEVSRYIRERAGDGMKLDRKGGKLARDFVPAVFAICTSTAMRRSAPSDLRCEQARVAEGGRDVSERMLSVRRRPQRIVPGCDMRLAAANSVADKRPAFFT